MLVVLLYLTGETPINADYRQIGLIGTGHLTSVEETYADNPNYPPQQGSDDNSEPFIVTGKFGINKTVPTASLHVGTGDVLFDNDLKVEGDVTINGGDLKTSATTFNYTDTSTTVNFATSATALNFGASNSTTFAAAIAAGGGPSDGTSVTTLNSDKLKLYADVELVGRFDSGTAGDRTVEIYYYSKNN